MTPSVVFGVTLYNNARHLPEALESLLAQSDPDFGLMLVDDASVDSTEAVARRYLSDSRVRYVRHAERRGMVPTWRDAVHQAVEAFPSARYFAWASDHDWWHPDWLRRVRGALESRADVVLAYALTQRVDDARHPLDKPPKAFDTTRVDAVSARVLAFAGEPVGAGDMVYGLMRIDALRRAGVFRTVMQPDRLLMVELALAGRFAQVPEVLWFRRQPEQASVEKQGTSLFAGVSPAGLAVPIWVQHSQLLFREYVVGARPTGVGAVQMVALILRYQATYLYRHHTKQGYLLHRLDQRWEAVVQSWKDARYEWRWIWYRMRMRLRPKHVARVTEKYALHVVRRAVYSAAVARRRVRAWSYESGQWLRRRVLLGRRHAKRGLHELLVLTHRLRLRGRRGTP
jgi:hypothetical protein